jgi:hypothetical protein
MSNISCTEFVRRLEQTIESRRAVETSELRAHAAGCAVCRAEWLDALLLDGAVADWQKSGKKIVPSVDLTDAVLFRKTASQEAAISASLTPFATSTVDSAFNTENDATGNRFVAHVAPAASFQSTPSRRSLGRRTAAVFVVLVAAAICVTVFRVRPTRQKGEVEVIARSVPRQPNVAAVTPTAITARNEHAESSRIVQNQPVAIKTVAAEPVQAMVQNVETAYLDLASEAADAVAGATVLVPRPSPGGATAKSGDENDRWVDDVGRQFEPVSKNLSQAFQFLINAVPADKAPPT